MIRRVLQPTLDFNENSRGRGSIVVEKKFHQTAKILKWYFFNRRKDYFQAPINELEEDEDEQAGDDETEDGDTEENDEEEKESTEGGGEVQI